jgi:cyclophilin family peptidyl-prolyl cis-trans isomerase
MKKSSLLLAAAGVLFTFATHAMAAERVRVTTNLGAFVVELQRDRAPLTVENFLGYVRSGYYTNTLFHRVISNFVIQGGGVGPDYKSKATNKPIPNESGNGLKNLRGTVGLARASGPHSGDVQFYVNVADNADLDPLPTRWGYAVFGKIVEGMEVVDRISVSPTGTAGPFKQAAPLQQVIIQKVEIVAEPGSRAATPAPAPTPTSTPAQTPAQTPAGESAPATAPPTDGAAPAPAEKPTPPPADAPPPK